MSLADKYTTLTEKIPQVYEAGKQAEYDAFWDGFQNNGTRTYYNNAFARGYWKNGSTYNPKYPIICTANGATSMFSSSSVSDTLVPITISGSNSSVFYGSNISTIPYLDVSGMTSIIGDWFTNCTKLANLTMVGEIAVSISFKDCPLIAKSLVSIVEHLSDTASGKTLTVNATAVTNADWSTTDYASWDALIATKPNWSFSLA